MSVLFMFTGDLQAQELWDTYDAVNTIVSTDYARTGTYSFLIANNRTVTKLIPSSSTVYIKTAVFLKNSGYYTRIYFYNEVDGAIQHVYLEISPTLIKVYRGTTEIDSAANPYSFYYNWVVIEAKVTINDSTGIVQVKINGDLLIDFTGDTRNGGTIQEIDKIGLFSTQCYYDDIVVRDDDWPGRGGIYVLSPNAGSTNENWTASAGNPEECVDELPVSYSDYIYTDGTVDNTEHLFGLTNLAITPSEINAVGVFCNIMSPEPTSSYLRTLLKSGTTTDVGSSVGVDTSSIWISSFYAINPDDSAAWEKADIDALEIGVETVVP